jgi:Putative transposase/Transposase zinc-binding domain
VALPSVDYTPRDPAADVLHRVVRDHLQTFLAEAAHRRDGEGVPRFVEKEFQAFLSCGWLAAGFARFRCGGCKTERLVAFSCKGRGFCPSCGGRRMTERAAHLVDAVLPDVPVRQWVLTLPHRIRYLLAWRHDLCKAVVRVLLREVHRHLRTRAHERGLSDVRGGAVAVVQRFGGALNRNVHIHALVLDGVFARGQDGGLRFHPTPELNAADVADVLAAIAPGVQRVLARHDSDPDDPSASDAFAETSPLLAGLAAASVQGTVALGGTPGARPRRMGQTSVDRGVPAPGRCHARWEGFDLQAAVRVPAGQRDRLERVCRYTLRPPVVMQLRHPWADGTTHVAFTPTAFLERLAVLVPRPHVNLLLYHGVLAPRALWRAEVVAHGASDTALGPPAGTPAACETPRRAARGASWADLMRRTFEVDVLACPRGGGRLRLIALIEASETARRT